jgi:hypothetical protein
MMTKKVANRGRPNGGLGSNSTYDARNETKREKETEIIP